MKYGFLDIERAFSNMKLDAVIEALKTLRQQKEE